MCFSLPIATRHGNSVELPMSSPSCASEDHAPSFSFGGTYPTHQLLVTATTPDYDAERFLRDSDVGVEFLPVPQQLTEAEVHIPHSGTPGEVVSTSVRAHPDEVGTPKSSLAPDPSPLAVIATDILAVPVETPSPVPTGRPGYPPQEEKGVVTTYPTRSTAVRVTSLLPESLQLPLGPRKRIVISSASSATSSCDGDVSEEVASDDSTDGVIPRMRLLPHSAISPRRKRWTGSHEYLVPTATDVVGVRSHSVSPTPRGSPAESYSEDDTVLVTRRRVDTHRHAQLRGSFFNLSPAPSMEVIEFSTPRGGCPSTSSSLTRSSSLRLPRERHTSPYPSPAANSSQAPMATMSRTVPLSAITHTQ